MFHGFFSVVAATLTTDKGWRWRGVPAMLSLGAVIYLTLFSSLAGAESSKLISFGNFNPQTPLPVGAAVDQSKGEVYVSGLLLLENFHPGQVSKFSTSIPPASVLPSPFGTAYDSGVAVNPKNGDVYVLGELGLGELVAEPLIFTYNPSTGEVVGEPFPVPPADFFGEQIASDSNGDVYVPIGPSNEVLEYSPTGTLLMAFTGGTGSSALNNPTGVAVDSSGNLWVADQGNNRIEELQPSGAPVEIDGKAVEIRSEGVLSVALDGDGDVFAIVNNSADPCGSLPSPCSHLVEYDATGVQVADVGAGTFGIIETPFPLPSGIAVDESTGRVYVPDGFKEVVWIFGPPPPTPPVVGTELASEVTATEAKLGASVNPGGLQTSYRFEYGATVAYGHSVPVPEGSVGEGIAARTVWAAASGLVPGVTYHYHVVATNELGTTEGPDQTFTTQTAVQAACPNEEFRSGFSARLPDCRAYELATPSTKLSSQPIGSGPPATDGNAIKFETSEPLPNATTGGAHYVATRGAGGWSAEDLIPLESYTGILCSTEDNSVPAESDDLSKALVSIGKDTRASKGGEGAAFDSCNAEGLQVAPGEPVGYENLLLRDSQTGTYQLVNLPPPGVTPADAHFKGASADLSHVVFSEMAPLTANAPHGVENLFEWDEGVLRLVSVLPDGTPVVGSLAEGREGEDGGQAISTEGSHVLFTSGGNLYVRIDGERTVQVDENQGGSGTSGGGVFQTASGDGSRVFFTDQSQLTEDSSAAGGEPDLYECALPEGASQCQLTDLTVAKPTEHADVLQISALGSKDSSHLYFTARGALASNKREYEDTGGHVVVEEAKGGENNLYLDNAGTVTFIATLAEGDGSGPVSPDGRWLAFASSKSLTGYDNGSTEEIFLYDSDSGELVCASCNPSGEAPTSGGQFSRTLGIDSRALSDGGRLFFETSDALVPSDTNGQIDVYEYEDGRLSLISSGTSSTESTFSGASESGDDAFFVSTQQLVPQDTEEETIVVYDARVGGGFPAVASPPACTTADACRAPTPPQPSIYGAPSSQTFSGAGNLVPTAQAKPKAKIKHTKKTKSKKKRRRACKRNGRRNCASQKHKAAARVKSHKGGKRS